ncbi:hypothetical protein PHJA_002667200 [Phtheirospermum japonicum]|uniref:Uncharacterized protein n=1 Tax=Phtheirospermum japonicum TaxID=374723 RepID=A0A830CZ68_9LAMI|nr:hypothetical protein PHJA_002667200 [Phtheirospermum japonicum]
MGVTMRAGNGHIHGAYRRRWNVYVWMVIIAMVLGCGILLGVMGLHKLRERRILNLLIKEKDAQLLSLHLLLQKEREHTQEIKAKTDELRIKMYNLRARNAELKSKISDLHSTISSLRDDQTTIELRFKEKQNEAKLALTETTQRKEAEIEGLKHHLQLCANVESLSKKDEPSIVPVIERRTIDPSQEGEYENDKTIDEEGNKANFTGIKEFATIGNADSGQISNSSQEIDNRELGVTQIEKQGKRDENGSSLKSQQFGIYDHKQLQENNGEKIENGPPGVESEDSTKPVDTELSESDGEHNNSRGRIKVAKSELGTITSTKFARIATGENRQEDEGRMNEPEISVQVNETPRARFPAASAAANPECILVNALWISDSALYCAIESRESTTCFKIGLCEGNWI